MPTKYTIDCFQDEAYTDTKLKMPQEKVPTLLFALHIVSKVILHVQRQNLIYGNSLDTINIPRGSVLVLLEDPGLCQCTATYHHGIDAGLLHPSSSIAMCQNAAITDDG